MSMARLAPRPVLDLSSAPRTWPAVDDAGHPLSDHELITVDLG